MALKLHLPPEDIRIPYDEPLIFAGGPIQGAPDWQAESYSLLDDMIDEEITAHLANPRRGKLGEDFNYNVQASWEKQRLQRAAQFGVLLFWLAAKDPTLPYKEGRAYAQTTRIEFGRALGWHDYDPQIKVVLGIEPGYIGSERYYQHSAQEKRWPIHDTLDSACSEVAEHIATLLDRDIRGL